MSNLFKHKPFIKDQQIDLLIRFNNLCKFAAGFCDAKLIKQLRHSYVPYSFELTAGRVSKSAGYVSLSVA